MPKLGDVEALPASRATLDGWLRLGLAITIFSIRDLRGQNDYWYKSTNLNGFQRMPEDELIRWLKHDGLIYMHAAGYEFDNEFWNAWVEAGCPNCE